MSVDRPPWTRFGSWLAGLVALDLVTKWLAVTVAGSQDRWLITPRVNEELALGVTSGETHPLVLGAMAFVAVAVFVHAWRLHASGRLPAYAYAALVGGTLANLVDRLATGGVHDWLRTGPIVINVADVLIVVGLVAYVVAASKSQT